MRWFWAAIITPIVLAGLMTPLAGIPNNRVRKALGLRLPLLGGNRPLGSGRTRTSRRRSRKSRRFRPRPSGSSDSESSSGSWSSSRS